MKLTKEQEDKLLSFLSETFCFTEEQMAAMDHQTEMTQELFDSILDRCGELGDSGKRIMFRMHKEFPELFEHNVKEILKEYGIED